MTRACAILPLAGSSRWARSRNCTPTLTDVNQIEVHQDTWDSGFTVYYDGLRFEVTVPSAPTLAATLLSSNLVRLTVRGVDGFAHIIEASSDLERWTAVRTNVPVAGVMEWTEAASGQKFFRAQVP